MQPTNHQPTGTPDILSALPGAGAVVPRTTDASDEANELLAELEDGIASIFAELHAAEAAETEDAAASATPADGAVAAAHADDAAPAEDEADEEAEAEAVAKADRLTQQLLGELDRLWQRHAA